MSPPRVPLGLRLLRRRWVLAALVIFNLAGLIDAAYDEPTRWLQRGRVTGAFRGRHPKCERPSPEAQRRLRPASTLKLELTRSDGHGMVRSVRCRWSSENPECGTDLTTVYGSIGVGVVQASAGWESGATADSWEGFVQLPTVGGSAPRLTKVGPASFGTGVIHWWAIC